MSGVEVARAMSLASPHVDYALVDDGPLPVMMSGLGKSPIHTDAFPVEAYGAEAATIAGAGLSPLQLLGHSGGSAGAVFVTDTYVYAGLGPELAILERTDPLSPTRLGYVVLPGSVRDIEVVGEYAYVVVDYSHILYQVHVADPYAPVVKGAYSLGSGYSTSYLNGLTVAGNYLYVVWGKCRYPAICDGGLRILDISSPTLPPVEVGVYGDYPMLDVVIQGDYAYLSQGAENMFPSDTNLVVVNVTNPQSPTTVSVYPTSDVIFQIRVKGQYAYIVLWGGGSLRILNISNPTALYEVGVYDAAGYGRALALVDDYAYVVQRVEIGDTYQYELHIVEMTNPAAPTMVNSYVTGYVAEMAVAGTEIYIAKEDGCVDIWDVTQPITPTAMGGYAPPGVGYDVAISGTRAYLAYGELQVLDITNPSVPQEVGRYAPPGTATRVVVAGDYAYLATDTAGLRVVDIATPTAPVEIGAYLPPTDTISVKELTIAGDYAYLATEEHGLRIVDISDPTQPYEVGGYTPIVQKVAVQGIYAYLISTNEVHIVDISDPTTPVRIASHEISTAYYGYAFTSLSLAGDYLYVVQSIEIPASPGSSIWSNTLYIADVSNPTAPIWLDAYRLPGKYGVLGVEAAHGYVFTLYNSSGLCVTDIVNPAAPVDIGCYPMPPSWSKRDIEVVGDKVYVAGDMGFYVLRQVFPVTGQVHTVAGDPVTGVTLSASNGLSTTTSSRGTYTLTQLYSGTWTVTPTLASHSFWPPTRSVTVPPSAHDQDFMLLQRIIGGRVHDARGVPYPGVMLTLHTGVTTTTDARGVYTFTEVACTTCVLTPTLPGHLFWPPTRTVMLPPDTLTQDFVGREAVLRGAVSDPYGTAWRGVTLTLGTEAMSQVVTTDAQGAYTFTELLHGTYLLTPTLAGYAFVPPTRQVTLQPDTGSQPFMVLAGPVSVTVPLDTAQFPISLVFTDTQGLPTQVTVPAGVLTPGLTLRLTPRWMPSVPGYAFAGHAFDLDVLDAGRPLSLTFTAPFTLTLTYSDRDLRWVLTETDLAVWWWAGTAWWSQPGTLAPPVYARDVEHHLLRVPLYRTGRYALFGPRRYDVYLPLVLRGE